MKCSIPGPKSRGQAITLALGQIVATPENHAALVAIRQIGESFQRGHHVAPNHLFLHGPPGCGKTLLVKTLVDELVRRDSSVTVCLLSAGDLKQLDSNSNPLDEARQADLLVVEDLQHLPANAAELLVQLFDDLHAVERSMVFTASVGPAQLASCSHRLCSRLASGLVVGVSPLSASSRFHVLQDKAQRRQLAVSPELLAWLAKQARGGREIEGTLNRLETLLRESHRGLDTATLGEHLGIEATEPLTVERIAERVCSYFQVPARQLRSEGRGRHILLPRQVSMYLARLLTGLSLREIGQYFGGRDHSTVLHACRKVAEAIARDALLCGAVRQLQAELA